MCDATFILMMRDIETPCIHEITLNQKDGHHRASDDIIFYHDTLTELVRWAKYPAKHEPLTQGRFSLNGGKDVNVFNLAIVKHHNLMYKREPCYDMPAPHVVVRKSEHLLPGHHLFTKQRTVNNTVTYIDKRIHHLVRFFLKKDVDEGIGFMPSVYISRLKEEQVAIKLHKLLFAKHKHIDMIMLINDHHSGASMIGLMGHKGASL